MKILPKTLLSSALTALLLMCQIQAHAKNHLGTSNGFSYNNNCTISYSDSNTDNYTDSHTDSNTDNYTDSHTDSNTDNYKGSHTTSYNYSDSVGIKTALLIVDIQNFYFPGDGPGLVNAENASLEAQKVLEHFRQNSQLVVHVRHKSKKGFDIHKNVAPLPTEKVITKEDVNSFKGTDLLEFLQANNVKRLVIMGMQTQMCLEAAVRAAHDYGFECVVVADACATRDLKFGDKIVKAEDVQTAVFATLTDGRYAKVASSASVCGN